MSLLVPRRVVSRLSRVRSRFYSLTGSPIDISPEVQHALQTGAPVVALESAIITHGMPHPVNLETALSVETKVRAGGSIPATIAVLDGRIKVGLQKSQLEILADKSDKRFIKLSRRDLAVAAGLGRSGGTTISATSLIASLVGIRVFATGGLGGVHRGGEVSWDVSADLTELGRTPIAVISAGVKSILDIGRTLEYLETQGVAVMTYGPTSEFPGFFSPTTGYQSPWQVNSPKDAASIINASHRLGLKSGMLFAAPIPDEYAGAAAVIQEAVETAIRESEENGMSKRGKEATPWILNRISELTQGKSLPSNVALIENTAFIGGRIAAEYAKLVRDDTEDSNTPCHPVRLSPLNAPSEVKLNASKFQVPSTLPPATHFVVGAAAVDVISQRLTVQPHVTHSTSPGKVAFSLGGVARNIAEAAHRILSTSNKSASDSHRVLLVSPIGDDLTANLILGDARQVGMRTDGFLTDHDQRSAVCNMHLDATGNLITGVADMAIVEALDAEVIIELINKHSPKLVAFDANLNSKTLSSLVQFCGQRQIPILFEPTSIPKSTGILPALAETTESGHFNSPPITFASPNQLELSHLFHAIRSSSLELTDRPYWWSVMDDLNLGEQYRTDLTLLSRSAALNSSDFNTCLIDGIPQMAISLLPYFQHLFIKCGKNGVFVVMRLVGELAMNGVWAKERTRAERRQLVAQGHSSLLVMKHYPSLLVQPGDIINVTGAGDSFVGSLLASLSDDEAIGTPQGLNEIIERAQYAACLSLGSLQAVSPKLSSTIVKPI